MNSFAVSSLVISLGVTVALLLISLLAFRTVGLTDYILIGIGAIELIQLICILVRRKRRTTGNRRSRNVN